MSIWSDDGKRCPEVKVNRKVPDFTCSFHWGHSEPHRDPAIGTRWNHPKLPYGVTIKREDA